MEFEDTEKFSNPRRAFHRGHLIESIKIERKYININQS
jgi:hypothetical protein